MAIPLFRFSIAFVLCTSAIQRPLDAQALKCERFLEALAHRGGCSRMIGFERGSKPFEPCLGQLGIVQTPGFTKDGFHALVHPLRQVSQDVALLLELATLNDSPIPEASLHQPPRSVATCGNPVAQSTRKGPV